MIRWVSPQAPSFGVWSDRLRESWPGFFLALCFQEHSSSSGGNGRVPHSCTWSPPDSPCVPWTPRPAGQPGGFSALLSCPGQLNPAGPSGVGVKEDQPQHPGKRPSCLGDTTWCPHPGLTWPPAAHLGKSSVPQWTYSFPSGGAPALATSWGRGATYRSLVALLPPCLSPSGGFF